MILQIPLRIDRRHAAGAGGGNRLAVDMVLDIAAGKDTGDIGLGAVVGEDVSGRIEIELADEQFGIGLMADGDEQAVAFEVGSLAGF